MRLACELAKVERSTVYKFRWTAESARLKSDSPINADGTPRQYDDFVAQWDSAIENACDRLEQEAWRRAVYGVDEPEFYQGDVCGVVRKYSDTLMALLLKAHRPDKYRERFENVGNPLFAVTQITGDELGKARSEAADWEKQTFGAAPAVPVDQGNGK